MQRLVQLSLPVLVAVWLCQAACSNPDAEGAGKSPEKDSVTELSAVTVELPYAKGVELVERACVPCHSLRYIEIQPAMPRKNWAKIVDKMIKAYGAPVGDSVSAARIVGYLVAVRGA